MKIILLIFITFNIHAESGIKILKNECEKDKAPIACYKLSEIYFQRKNTKKAIQYLSQTCEMNYKKSCSIELLNDSTPKQMNKKYLTFLNKLERCDKIKWTENSPANQPIYFSTQKLKKDQNICIYNYIYPQKLEYSCKFSKRNIENLKKRTKDYNEFQLEVDFYTSLGVCEMKTKKNSMISKKKKKDFYNNRFKVKLDKCIHHIWQDHSNPQDVATMNTFPEGDNCIYTYLNLSSFSKCTFTPNDIEFIMKKTSKLNEFIDHFFVKRANGSCVTLLF